MNDHVFILHIARKQIIHQLAKAESSLSVKSAKLQNMDMNRTTQRARAMARVAATCQAEERDRWERRLEVVDNWIEEEKSC